MTAINNKETGARRKSVELTRYRSLVDHATDLMWVTDDEGYLIAVNKKATSVLGYTEEELIGRLGRSVVPDFEVQRLLEMKQMARDGGLAVFTINLKRKDGTLVPMQAFLRFDPTDGVFEAISVDLSERMRMEDEIRRKTEQANEESRRALAVAEERDRLFRYVSHELRSPLTAVLAFSEMLLEDQEDPLTAGQRVKMKRIADSAQRMLVLIGDLLDYSRLDTGKMRIVYSQVDVRSLIKQLASVAAPHAQEKNITLTARAPSNIGTVTTDEQRLSQIIMNLVSNAIRYTDEGTVAITARRNGEHVLISVKDTGVGIPAEEQDKIFREFYQVPGRKGVREGSGLGLPIARKLAELLGGALSLSSRVGEGSTFTLRLPVDPGIAAKHD